MESLTIIVQLLIALGILNVWILRYGKSTEWRGGDAKNMKEEFEVYGLPAWFMALVRFLKIALAILLILGVWFPYLTGPAAIGMAVLMLGAISMHIKVKDQLKKAAPAFSLLILCLIVVFMAN